MADAIQARWIAGRIRSRSIAHSTCEKLCNAIYAKGSQLAERYKDDLLITSYKQLLSDAAYRRIGWNPNLGETANATAPLRLLELLRIAAKKAEPKANSRRHARLVLKAFHRILDALYSYRQDWTASPRFPDEIRRQLVRRLKILKRARKQDLAGSLEKLIADPNLGHGLLWALKQTVDAIADKTSSRNGQAAHTLLERISTSPPADPEPWVRTASTDPDLIGDVVDRTIKRLEPKDADEHLKTCLRRLVHKPTKRKWSSAVDSMLDGGANRKKIARVRARAVGRRIGLFANRLPRNWTDIVADDENRIQQFAKGLLDHFSGVSERKRGRPTLPALQSYTNAVNAAYHDLTGKNLTLTRPTDKSAPDKRGRTTGFGLDLMTAALRLVDASMGPKEARTLIERLTKL